MISPSNSQVRAGTSVDFTGSNFAPNETIIVTNNGQGVGTAHADSSGNFSTGSIPVNTSTGSQTYTFAGQTNGDSASATVTIVQ